MEKKKLTHVQRNTAERMYVTKSIPNINDLTMKAS